MHARRPLVKDRHAHNNMSRHHLISPFQVLALPSSRHRIHELVSHSVVVFREVSHGISDSGELQRGIDIGDIDNTVDFLIMHELVLHNSHIASHFGGPMSGRQRNCILHTLPVSMYLPEKC